MLVLTLSLLMLGYLFLRPWGNLKTDAKASEGGPIKAERLEPNGVHISLCSSRALPGSLPPTYVACDVETTGLVPSRSELLEIGAVRFIDGRKADSFSTFVRPSRGVPREITRLTGITTKMVSNAPSPRDALKSFLEWSNGDLLVAHNAKFEAGFLGEHLARNSLHGSLTFLCTCDLARETLVLENYKLKTVTSSLGISLKNAHRALPDAEACGEVAFKIMERRAERERTIRLQEEERRRKDHERGPR